MNKDYMASLDAISAYALALREKRPLPSHDETDRAKIHDAMIKLQGDGAREVLLISLLSLLRSGLRLHPELEGDAALRWYFGERWLRGDEVYPSACDSIQIGHSLPMGRNDLRTRLLSVLDEADRSPTTRTVDVEFAYLMVPGVVERLARLARGNDVRPPAGVRLLVPGDSAKGYCDYEIAYLVLRDMYPTLIEAGVEVYEYEGFNHAKVIAVNGDELIWISSGNPEPHSWRVARDVVAVIRRAPALGAALTRMFETDFSPERSHRVRRDEVMATSAWRYLHGKIYGLFNSLALLRVSDHPV